MQQVVSEEVVQADTNDHQEKEYKDSKQEDEAAPTMPLQAPAPRTLAKQGDGKDKAMAMDPGADDKCDHKLNANFTSARSRGKGQRLV